MFFSEYIVVLYEDGCPAFFFANVFKYSGHLFSLSLTCADPLDNNNSLVVSISSNLKDLNSFVSVTRPPIPVFVFPVPGFVVNTITSIFSLLIVICFFSPSFVLMSSKQ